MITEQMIAEQVEAYEDYHAEVIQEQNLFVYVNREIDSEGAILSAYIGLEDEVGRAITGHDEPVLPF